VAIRSITGNSSKGKQRIASKGEQLAKSRYCIQYSLLF